MCTGAGRRSQETEAGLQAGAGGGLHESGELRTALPRAHWEETPSETEPCLSEDLSPPPNFFHHVTSSLRLSKMTSSLTFFSASSSHPPREIFLFSSSTLLHRLVYLIYPKGGAGLRAASPTVQCGGTLQLHHGERFKGRLLESWPYWHTSVPLLDEERGEKKTFLCCLQEFTLIGNSLKNHGVGFPFC